MSTFVLKLSSTLRNNSVVKNAAALFVGKGINLFIGLFSTLIYGIIFLKKDIAIIGLFEMLASLFLSFGFTWSALAVTRFGKDELQKNNSINYTSSLRFGILIPVLFVSIFIILFFRDTFIKYIGTDDTTIIFYLICNLILLVIHEHITTIFTALEKHPLNALYHVGVGLGKLCILLLFYFSILKNIRAELYLKYNVYVLLLLLIGRSFFIKYKYIFPLILGKKEDYKRQLNYVLPQIYGFSGLYVINWVDLYFIRKYMSLDDVGAYQFMYSIFSKFAYFAIILNTIFFPRIMHWKITKSDKLKAYLKKAPILVLLTTVIIFTIFLQIYQPLFSIFFKEKYSNAYKAFNILIMCIPFYFGIYVYVPVLNSFDRVKYLQNVNIFTAILNILFDYYFIESLGLIAAGFATFIAYFSKYVLISIAAQKMFSIKSKFSNIFSIVYFMIVVSYFIIEAF